MGGYQGLSFWHVGLVYDLRMLGYDLACFFLLFVGMLEFSCEAFNSCCIPPFLLSSSRISMFGEQGLFIHYCRAMYNVIFMPVSLRRPMYYSTSALRLTYQPLQLLRLLLRHYLPELIHCQEIMVRVLEAGYDSLSPNNVSIILSIIAPFLLLST